MIEILTFTGVDDSTSIINLKQIAENYPRVEFGVLVGSQTGGIFPSMTRVRSLRDSGIPCSLHLCGVYSRSALAKEPPPDDLYELCKGFDRVQVNLHGDFWTDTWIDVNREGIIRFAEKAQVESVILQHRGSWESIPVEHPKVEYLWDVSGGAGKDSVDLWPSPTLPVRVGYAGGLGPENMKSALEFAKRHGDHPVWFDMESGVRDIYGDFDLRAVRSVCHTVFDVFEGVVGLNGSLDEVTMKRALGYVEGYIERNIQSPQGDYVRGFLMALKEGRRPGETVAK